MWSRVPASPPRPSTRRVGGAGYARLPFEKGNLHYAKYSSMLIALILSVVDVVYISEIIVRTAPEMSGKNQLSSTVFHVNLTVHAHKNN